MKKNKKNAIRTEERIIKMDKRSLFSNFGYIVIGEIIVSVITVGVFLLFDKFSYKVVTGVILGSAVIIFNFLFLAISVSRAVDQFMRLRGDKEMSEEEAQKFAQENSMLIQNATKLSYLIRTFTMLLALILAMLLGVFDVIATVVPLLAFRPILMAGELLTKKKGGE